MVKFVILVIVSWASIYWYFKYIAPRLLPWIVRHLQYS